MTYDDEVSPNSGTLVRDKLWFDDGFAMVPNAWIRDTKLTRTARMIAVELASHTAGFELSIEYLVKNGTEGRDAITSALAALEKAGYLKRYRGRERGQFGRIKWHLRDPHMPQNLHGAMQLDLEEMPPLRTKRGRSEPQTGFPLAVDPLAVKPLAVDPGTIEDHSREYLTQVNQADPGTRAGEELGAFGTLLEVAAENDAAALWRIEHQPCPMRRDGREHTFAPGTGCTTCGIRMDQRWDGPDIAMKADLEARLKPAATGPSDREMDAHAAQQQASA